MNEDRHKRKMSAIFSADVVGYSRLMEADEAWTIKSLEENRNLISNLIEDYHGRVVDAPGDNILAEFSSVSNAVECAVKIQQELKVKNSRLKEEHQMEFRIGINLGEIVEEGGRIYGSGVNIAARIEGLSKSGGICISGRTYDHIKSKFDFGYEYLGEHNVKNISEPIRVYRVLMEPEASGIVIGEKRSSNKVSSRMSMFIILIIVVAGLSGWFIYSNQSKKLEQISIETEQLPAVQNIKEAPKTIVVLPFENISPEKDQEYFVDGLSEQIINDLTKISNLNVTSRTSSFAFKGSDKTAKEIAQILEREYILEGSVRKAGNALKITTQLIRATDDSHIWSEIYDREMEDIFEIQVDIASKVAEKLKLTIESLGLLGGTENFEAYELYLKAKGQFQRESAPSSFLEIEPHRSALQLINEAIAIDPKFALAYVEKARSHLNIASRISPSLAAEEWDYAIEATKKALELEPNLGPPYVMMCYIKQWRGHFIEAEVYGLKAIELLSGTITGDEDWIPGFYNAVGKYEKALKLLIQIQKNDPLHEGYRGHYMFSLALRGDIKGAEDLYESCVEKFHDIDWYNWCITFIRIGTSDNLTRDKIVHSNPIFDLGKKHIGSPEEGLNRLKKLYNNNDELDSQSLFAILILAAYFGDSDFAMTVLERTAHIESNLTTSLWLKVFKDVRKTSRFKKYIREIGLFDYWKEYGWPDNNICHPVGDDDFECD